LHVPAKDEEFATPRRRFTPREIVEIAIVVGRYVAGANYCGAAGAG
jgi:hypothetical protein